MEATPRSHAYLRSARPLAPLPYIRHPSAPPHPSYAYASANPTIHVPTCLFRPILPSATMDPFALLPILSTFSKIKATFNALSQWINDLTTLVFTDASFGDAFVYGSSCRNVEFVGRLRHFWSPIRGATRTDFFEGQQRLDYAEIRSWKTLVATYG